MNNVWDEIYNLQENLYYVESFEEFETVKEALIAKNNEMNDMYAAMDHAHAARRMAEEERNGLYQKAYVDELKGEADYRAAFVK